MRSPDESAVDRIVERLPGDRASRRTRLRTLLRLGLCGSAVQAIADGAELRAAAAGLAGGVHA